MLEKKNSTVYAPVFVSVILLLLLISENIIKTAVSGGTDYYLSYTVVQLIVYMLPLAFYCKVRNVMFFEALKFNLFSYRYLLLIVCLGLMFLSSILLFLFGDLYYFNGVLAANKMTSVSFSSDEALYALIALVIVPAIVKELLFRGIVLTEYRVYGAIPAIIMSSLLFSLSSMNFSSLPILFYSGIFFGIISIATDSVIPSVVLHIIYNAFSIYASSTVITYMEKISDSAMPLFVLGVILLLLLFLVFCVLESIYNKKAEDCGEQNEVIKKLNALGENADEKNDVKEKMNISAMAYELFASPALWCCLAIFIIAAVINL